MAANQDKTVDKATALQTALSQIEKQFGKGAVMRLGQKPGHECGGHPDRLPSPWTSRLELAAFRAAALLKFMGLKAPARLRWRCIALPRGKKGGGTAAFIDVEHALDPVCASNLGVDVEALLVSQPDTGEQALEITEALVRSGAIDVIVVDSVAALVPRCGN